MSNWNAPDLPERSNQHGGPPPMREPSIQQQFPPSVPPAQSGMGINSVIPSRPRASWPTEAETLGPEGSNQAFHQSRLVASTMNVVRGWSGKMASLAGYRPDPPAPPMERYHEPHQPVSPLLPAHVRPWRRSRTTRIVRHMRGRRARWQRGSQGAIGRICIAITAALLLLLAVTGGSGTAYGYNYYQSQLPLVDRLAQSRISQTTRIFDRNNVLLYDAYDDLKGRRTPVEYKDIPAIMQDAMTTTEDKTFWQNQGIDPTGIYRSYTNGVGGGSGITQQVIKNLSNNKEYSVQRKLNEAVLSVGLTQQYPKWKILEMYFNVAPFGNQDVGVEAAVEDYFHLLPKCEKTSCSLGITRLDYESDANPHDPILALARASLLAGMPQKPGTNDPTLDNASKQRALARQKDVLNLMINEGISYGPGKITPAIAQKAEERTAQMTFTPYNHNAKRAPHFVDWVINQVASSLGADGVNTFYTGGFNIRTSIDVNLEDFVEAQVRLHITQPEYQKFRYVTHTLNADDNVNDAAVVVMNAKTGEILAMDGSTDYNDNNIKVSGNLNLATSPRQPGSTFKPIIYATAFQMGWTPGIVLPDVPTYFPNKLSAGAPIPLTDAQKINGTYAYTPSDYGGGYNPAISPMTIRTATANSFNVPAVKAMQYAGLDNVVNTADRMGLGSAIQKDAQSIQCNPDTIKSNVSSCYGMSMVLGTTAVPLIDMVGAYQVFANQGSRVSTQGVLDIWDNYGHSLYHFDPNAVKGTPVLSPQVAYMMTSVLSDEYARHHEFAGDNDLSFADHDPACGYSHAPDNYQNCQYQVAAKTGTTDSYVDNWTIGYTPNVVVGVWAGNANAEPMAKGVIGVTGAAPIWHGVMEYTANGWCADTCPQVNRDNLHLGNQTQFTRPDNLDCAYTSGYNGLQGGGAGYCDWVLAGQEPQQNGTPPANNKPKDGKGGPPAQN